MPRMMLATDLDGTLLQPGGSVSERTREALERAEDAGLLVTFVTGRPPRWLSPVVHQTGWRGLAVSGNGAVLIDLEKRLVERTFPIEHDNLRTAVEIIREHLDGVKFAVESVAPGTAVPVADPLDARHHGPHSNFGHEPGYLPAVLKLPPNFQGKAPVEELVARGNVIKLLARGKPDDPRDPDETYHLLAQHLHDVVTVTHSTRDGILLEMSAANVSKASGVAWLAQAHGIDQANVVAIGDMLNDLPMLTWAGHGYAVANAHQTLIDYAGPSRVVPANTEDGVAELIDRLLGSEIAD